ncbi:Low affinity immunoglobulin epsilon Fc receptor, partial [Aphelenchoides avenae]
VNEVPGGNSFDRHLASCRRQGGSLVSIHSEDQQRFIEGLLQSDSAHPVWIGLHDAFKNGTWKWIDGTPLDYKNWGPSQPNNEDGAQFCVLMQ